MKRVANKIAVQSFVYTVGGNQLLRIIDHPSPKSMDSGGDGEIVFDDHLCGIYSYEYEKLLRSEILRTSIEVNMYGHPVIILEVSTKCDEY